MAQCFKLGYSETDQIVDTTLDKTQREINSLKADKIASPVNGNLLKMNSSGNLVDSGLAFETVSGDNVKLTGKYIDATGVYDRAYGMLQSAINDSKSGKSGNPIPYYKHDYPDSCCQLDPYDAIKACRRLYYGEFVRGSMIHIQIAQYGGYHTYIIGSTDPDYFNVLAIDYYAANGTPEWYRYSNGNWSKYTFNMTHVE